MRATVFVAVGYDNGGHDRPIVRAFSTVERAKAYAYDLGQGLSCAFAYEAILDDPAAGTEEDQGATEL